MIIDFHNHYFPPAFVDAVRAGASRFRLTEDAEGNPVLHSPGDYNVLVPGHRDIEYRARVLEEKGIDRQVISFTAPGTLIETPERGVELARMVNDGLADAVAWGDGRFTALGHLPLHAPGAARDELVRCVDELGFPGAMLFGNANGTPLADDRYLPLYEAADARGAVCYIHPTYPLGVEAMERYMLMPLVGFMFDTTLAAAHLVFAGIPDRFPRIRWALSHLGGAIPYLAERLDRGYEAFPRSRERLSRPPSEVLRGFWYDTVNFDPACLRLAIEFAGAGQILAGSDYPHMIGSLDRMLATIRSLELSRADEAQVLGANAERLLGT
ncbi:MAG: amidohydrolase family protein [Gemmatimonadota bacterium]